MQVKNNLNVQVSSRSTLTTSDVQSVLVSLGYTAARAANLDNLDVAVSTRSTLSASDVWSHSSRTLTSFGALPTSVATSVWAHGIDGSFTALQWMRLLGAVVFGNRVVAGSQETYMGVDGTTPRVVGSVDGAGNRTVTGLSG